MNPLVNPRARWLLWLLVVLFGPAELRPEANDTGNEVKKALGSFLDRALANAAKKESPSPANPAEPTVRVGASSAVVPLKLFWSSEKQDNYTTTAAGAEEARRNGYGEFRVEGYILAQAGPGAIPLKTYHNARLDDYVSVANPATEQQVQKDGYVFVRNEGFVFASAQPGTIPLQQYWNPERTDYQAAASADGIRDAGTWGYRFVRTEGFLLPSEQTPIPNAGGAAGLAGMVPAGPVGLRGEYFDNRDLSGPAKHTRVDAQVSFDWDNGAPAPGLPNDGFTVRWTGQIQPRYSEPYVLCGQRDDGLRVWIDGRQILDQWDPSDSGAFASAPVMLRANERHAIRVEYLEIAGRARLDLRWKSASQREETIPTACLFPASAGQTGDTKPPIDAGTGPGLLGTYFDNRELKGASKITRVDPTINFDWGSGSPGAGIPDDNFSVRWTGQIQPRYSEDYVLTGMRDNGFRLWVDGQLLIDLWNNETGPYTTRPIPLQANRRHDIKIEYYEDWGGAVVSLKWRSAKQPEEVVPAPCLFPSAVRPPEGEPRPPGTNTGATNQPRDKFDRSQWFATRGSWNNRFGEGTSYDDSAIEIDGEVITLKADRTDQVAALYSRPFALSPGDALVVKRTLWVHADSRKFEGCLTAFAVDDPGVNPNKPNHQDSLFNVGYRNFDYETDQNLFCLSDGKAFPPGPGKFAGGTAPITLPLWNQWFDEELRYQSDTGDTVYLINGRECLRYRAAPLNKPFIKLLMHPYGWGTGHYMKMKKIEISVSTRASGDGGGRGLRGEYFDNPDLRGSPKITRVDYGITHLWGDDSPGPGIPADNFSVRWTGQIQPRYSEAYVFSGYRDDGVRVWIDDRLIIDQWKEGNWAPFASAPVPLTANRRHKIRVEYLELQGQARFDLHWQSPSQREERIPATCLYPASAAAGDPPLTGSTDRLSWARPGPLLDGAAPLLSTLVDLQPMRQRDPVGSSALFAEREAARYRVLFQRQPDMLPSLAAALAQARVTYPPQGKAPAQHAETAEAVYEVDGMSFAVSLIKVNGQWKIQSL